ncbi:helix-turn-helix domain-containing protein [Haloarcula mannanilytica]|uniref:helix-turn-helix domain-containing protein n=1 Tax=Haloarcula mannanilytica TaxID=2509225 RepID=UPI001F322C16|nr:helix-turn-helix domain-containing protein [Haloarcula mannanilytica]
MIAHEPYPFLLGLVLRERGIPNRLMLTSDYFEGIATLAEWDDFRRLADEIQEQFGRFELVSVNQTETAGVPLGGGQFGRVVRNELSRDQLTVLQTAYEMGYYETPRKASADDIATELDIAQSTFSERLRLAESQLFDLVFSGDEDSVTPD